MTRIAISVAMLGAVLGASAAQGQNLQRRVASTPVVETQGFSLGVHTVVATGLTIAGPGIRSEISTARGWGAGVQVAYGFTPRLTAFVSADAIKQPSQFGPFDGEFGLSHIEIGGRMSFPRGNGRLVPFVTAVAGARALGAKSDEGGVSATLRITGNEFGGGGGVLYAISPSMAIDAAVIGVTGKFNKLQLSGDVSSGGTLTADPSTGLRLKVGLNWRP